MKVLFGIEKSRIQSFTWLAIAYWKWSEGDFQIYLLPHHLAKFYWNRQLEFRRITSPSFAHYLTLHYFFPAQSVFFIQFSPRHKTLLKVRVVHGKENYGILREQAVWIRLLQHSFLMTFYLRGRGRATYGSTTLSLYSPRVQLCWPRRNGAHISPGWYDKPQVRCKPYNGILSWTVSKNSGVGWKLESVFVTTVLLRTSKFNA